MAKRKSNALFNKEVEPKANEENVHIESLNEKVADSGISVEKDAEYDPTDKMMPSVVDEKDIELEGLKEELSRLWSENNILKQQIAQKDALLKNAASYELQNVALREENNKQLMKISELSFENAKMNCQLQELLKKCDVQLPRSDLATSSKNINNNHSTNVSYIHNRLKTDIHGYESWN